MTVREAPEARLVSGWTAALPSARTRETGDPLGIRVWADQVASALVPGLSNRTTRLQGYGLLCAGLHVVEAQNGTGWQTGHGVRFVDSDEAWLRLERIWVTGQVLWGPDAVTWPGRNVASRLVKSDPVDLTVPLLGSQLSSGAWGGYRRSAGLFGLIDASSGRGTKPSSVSLTSSGKAMAREWRKENQKWRGATSTISKAIGSGEIDRSSLEGLFVLDEYRSHEGQGDVLTRAVERQPDLAARLQLLRKVWDADGSIQPTVLCRNPTILSHEQTNLARQARALVRAFRLVERPYRQYLRFGPQGRRTGKGIPPDRKAWSDPCWRLAALHSPEAFQLVEMGSKTPGSWDGVAAWAAELAQRRGSQIAAPGTAPPGYDRALAPAMSLAAASALFSEGFMGSPAKGGKKRTASRAQRKAQRVSDEDANS
jgi:hypothetical protein